MGETKPLAFVAYSSREAAVGECIIQAISEVNPLSRSVQYEPWIFNDVPGNPLVSPILSKIDDSPFVVADITTLNLNVVYEIGFAIGRSKRVFLVRYDGAEADKTLAQEAGIFDTLGYYSYGTSDNLKFKLIGNIDPTPLPISYPLDRRAPVYVVEPPTRSAAAGHLISRIKKSGYRFRSFNSTEDIRLSANDAIRQVSVSSGVALLLQSAEISGSAVQNIRTMFVAGLSHGMSKPTLILAPAGYLAPLDVRDVVDFYKRPEDIAQHVANFCPLINDYSQQADPPAIEAAGLLQSMSVGDPTAENEMTTLGTYYLQTDQYRRALRGEVNLVVGRKGSGKTALFIQLRDKIRSDKRNIVVDLKPEGYQLLKLKEDILSYLADGARQHLITAFWEYIILLEVAYKLLEKDKNTYRFNHEIHDAYLALDKAYRVENFAGEGDFSERLATLSDQISASYKAKYGSNANQRLTAQAVTELVHTHDIRLLRNHITTYLERKQSVWILFDNLDKGWSTQGVDDIDAIALRCLIDAGRKIEREMRKADQPFYCIVFVRNDVYEHLMSNSPDYGKEMRAVLDWTDPDLLKEMLRLRLVSGLESNSSGVSFQQIWTMICTSHFNGEETSNYIIDRSLMRPRNVLKIFNHARGFANNFNRVKITEEDLEKGLRAYSQDILLELDRELSDVFPMAKDVLYFFIDSSNILTTNQVEDLLSEAGVKDEERDLVLDFLLYYGVLGVQSDGKSHFIYDVNYDLKPLKIRAARARGEVRYVLNSAFWPALGTLQVVEGEPQAQLPL